MIGFPSVGKSTLLTKLTGMIYLIIQEHSLRLQHMSSQRSLVFLVSYNTKGLKFNCSICPVLLKVPRTVKVEVNRLSLLEEHAILSLSCWTQQDQCNIRKLSSINWKVLASDWTKAHQTSNSRKKTRAASRFQEWWMLIESVTKRLRQFLESTESTMLTFV